MEIRQTHTLLVNPIEMRRTDHPIAMATQIAVTVIVADNQQQVRTASRFGG
jgi:hypothetical protein